MTAQQKLYERLQALQQTLTQLSEAMNHERAAIVALDTVTMEAQSKVLIDLFTRVAPLNQDIAAAVAAVAESLSAPGEKNITALAIKLPKAERELLISLQQSVQRSADKINSDLEINRMLLQDSLQFTTSSLQLFTNALKQTSTTTYGQQGRFVDAVEQPHIICKEI